MYFTLEDYKKISEYLRQNAWKDTDFPTATKVTNDDFVPIIQDDTNRKLSVSDLRSELSEGPRGESAYEVAVRHGYKGTEEEWLASLKGDTGDAPLLRISKDGQSIEISSDGGNTWLFFEKNFNKLRVLGYVDSVSALPKNANVGDIYGVWNQDADDGEGAYELYINTVKDWTLDYTITKVYDYDTELPSSATNGTTVLVPVNDLTIDKEKVDGYKVYRFNQSTNGWIMVLNTAEIYADHKDIINYGDNVYALVIGDTEGTYKLYRRVTGWIFFGTNASITYKLVQDVNEGTETNILSGKAVKDAYGEYVDNPEFIRVVVDANDRILYGILNDGNFYFGAGCPNQVKNYVQEQLDKIIGTDDATEKIDTINEMIAFFDEIKNDEKLKNLLDSLDNRITAERERAIQVEDTKVDKEEGKSLINKEYADGVSYVENPEFIRVDVDADDRILEATRVDGTKYFGGDIENQSAIISTIENPEFISVWLTSDDKILYGVQKDGNFYFGCGVPQLIISYITNKINETITEVTTTIDNKISEILGAGDTTTIIDTLKEITAFFAGFDNTLVLLEYLNKTYGEYTDNPEFIAIKTDSEDKILEGTRIDGKKYLPAGIDLGNAEIYEIENPEFIKVEVDANDRIINAIRRNGDVIVGGININELKRTVDSNVLGIEYDSETGNVYAIKGQDSNINLTMDEDGNIYKETNIG